MQDRTKLEMKLLTKTRTLLSKGSGERANTSLVNTYSHAVHLPILPSSLHLVFTLNKFTTLE